VALTGIVLGELEVDALLRRVELDTGHTPWCAQTQSTGKQGFNHSSHFFDSVIWINSRSVDLWTTRSRLAHKLHRALLCFIFPATSTRKTKNQKCQCRKTRILRNHIACAVLVWIRLTELARKSMKSIYQIKYEMLSGYLRHELRSPSVRFFGA